MNILRRAAQIVLDLNKIQTEAAIRLYGRLNFYKKLYAACGVPAEVAARLEEKLLAAMHRGLEEQHVLASRWVKGESDLATFIDRYKGWFTDYMDRCSRITIEELSQAV